MYPAKKNVLGSLRDTCANDIKGMRDENITRPFHRKNQDYGCFFRITTAIRATETAVTMIPNPVDFFGVVAAGVGRVVAEVWGIGVAVAVGVAVITTVIGDVLGTVVILSIGVVVIIVVGVEVT